MFADIRGRFLDIARFFVILCRMVRSVGQLLRSSTRWFGKRLCVCCRKASILAGFLLHLLVCCCCAGERIVARTYDQPNCICVVLPLTPQSFSNRCIFDVVGLLLFSTACQTATPCPCKAMDSRGVRAVIDSRNH
jgi:hypothetical protein